MTSESDQETRDGGMAPSDEERHYARLSATLDSIIEAVPPPTQQGANPVQPKPMQYKTRKIYNKGSKAVPRYVVTFGAMVFGQPEGFIPVGDRIDVAMTDDPEFLVDANGGIWLNEGQNDGCGPRCPPGLHDKPLNQIVDALEGKVSDDVRSAINLVVQAHGPTVMLFKVWRGFSYSVRNEIIKALVPPLVRP